MDMETNMAYKSQHLEKLLKEIINNNRLAEQKDIQKKLEENNVYLPQSTLSRWLKKLNIAKINNTYKVINYATLSDNKLIKSIKAAPPNLLVLHTSPGHAGMISHHIDSYISVENPDFGIIGTIAGDDTILIVIELTKDLDQVKSRLLNSIGSKISY